MGAVHIGSIERNLMMMVMSRALTSCRPPLSI